MEITVRDKAGHIVSYRWVEEVEGFNQDDDIEIHLDKNNRVWQILINEGICQDETKLAKIKSMARPP